MAAYRTLNALTFGLAVLAGAVPPVLAASQDSYATLQAENTVTPLPENAKWNAGKAMT